MCGIIGYVGRREATPILIDGLKKLEYRGYDSSGVGIISADGKISLRKTKGKIRNLEDLIKSHPLPFCRLGISHTRWATHGQPSQANAHPHTDNSGRITVVHNGIIENYQELKKQLQKKGYQFISQTDTEVVAHLVSSCLKKGDLVSAIREAVGKLKGAFALGVISSDQPDTLVALRIGSPLIIGIGEGENFIASDVPAILDYTRRIIYLQDGQMAVLRENSVDLSTFDGKKITPKIDKVSFTVSSAQKEGYAHFMLKEIHEQPKVVSDMLSTRIFDNHVNLTFNSQAGHEKGRLTEKQLGSVKNIIIVGCGTAYHAGMVGKYIVERLSGIPVTVDLSSEFRYRSPIIRPDTLVMAISQSGETADTLAAVKEARSKGAKIVSICNVVGSSLARESDGVLYTHAGPEIGVASTKAYTTQICMLYLLALKLAQIHKKISMAESQRFIKQLKHIPALLGQILKTKSTIAKIAEDNSHFGCFLYLGRNINFPSALEGALKLKEISYIPAEGYAAGEMKHGPIALIDEYRAVVCIAPQSDVYEKMISNMEEILSRRGRIIAIASQGDKTIANHAHHVVFVPKTDKLLTPLLVVLPLQLLAYYVAVKRGCNVDQPRNLAKSVTVE